MKCLFVLLSISSFIVSVLGEIKALTLCPNECSEMKACIDTIYANQKKYNVKLYPPNNDAFGKCNCQNTLSYLNCMNCYLPKDGKKTITAKGVNTNCSKILNLGDATNTENAAETPVVGDDNNNNTENPTNKDKEVKSEDNTLNNDNKGSKNDGSGSPVVGIVIVGAVGIVGALGYLVYSRKSKERPESMPFISKDAISPNRYSVNSSAKDISDIGSTNNLTSNYDTQFYANTDTNQYTYSFDQTKHEFNEQLDTNYQYGGQYNENSFKVIDNTNIFDSNIADSTAVGIASNIGVTSDVPTNVGAPATTGVANNLVVPATVGVDAVQENANYESRRESMLPGIQPTAVNVAGNYVVAYKYDPQLDDELALHVNDQIQIVEEYEDGWMKAYNITTGQEGMAPRVCIKEA